MKSASTFGQVLSGIRRQQGFASAHAFYRSRQGHKTMGISFANYLGLEKGKSLPRSWRLKGIIGALGLPEGSPELRELVRTYLAALLGGEELLELAFPQETTVPELADVSLGEAAARQALAQRTVQLSMSQWAVLGTDEAAYLCHVYLVNTPGWTADKALAARLKLTPARVAKALQALQKEGIIERESGKARSPFALKNIRGLPVIPATAALKARVLKQRDKLAGASPVRFYHSLTVRIPKRNLARYQRHLEDAVNLAAIYGDVEDDGDSSIHLIDARVHDLF
jgi:hypothetical protein